MFANAGIPGATPVGSTTRAQFEAILDINLTSVFLTIQASVPHLPRGGSIVLNGSVHATLGIPGASAYAASKGAVRSMTRVLASELAQRGIRVNIVTPGATKTPIWNVRAPTAEAYAALEAKMAGMIPLGRMSEADDVAGAVLFLSSDDAQSITAAEIVVDGGHTGAPAGAPILRL